MKLSVKRIMPWIVPLLIGFSPTAIAESSDDFVLLIPSKSQPFCNKQYEHITWVEHVPVPERDLDEAEMGEADDRGQIDIGRVDLDEDGKDEIIKVIWGPGVSDHALTIELYKDNALFSTLRSEHGIQPNFKIEDTDGDGRFEIIIWGGLWDPRMPGEEGITESTYEGHSAPHRYVVATHKLIRGEYLLWDIYTTKEKYEPFCREQPK